ADTLDTAYKRRVMVTALFSRAVGFVELADGKVFNSSAPVGEECEISPFLAKGSGFLTSDSQFTTAHHNIFGSVADPAECNVPVTFESKGGGSPTTANEFTAYTTPNSVDSAGFEGEQNLICIA